MKPLDLNIRIVDSYLELLKDLSVPAKLDLIAKLSKSVKKKPTSPENSFELAFGAWKGNEPVETLTKSIRTSRHFRRKIVDL
jgi:hypothetical protein